MIYLYGRFFFTFFSYVFLASSTSAKEHLSLQELFYKDQQIKKNQKNAQKELFFLQRVINFLNQSDLFFDKIAASPNNIKTDQHQLTCLLDQINAIESGCAASKAAKIEELQYLILGMDFLKEVFESIKDFKTLIPFTNKLNLKVKEALSSYEKKYLSHIQEFSTLENKTKNNYFVLQSKKSLERLQVEAQTYAIKEIIKEIRENINWLSLLDQL